jgi:hypothetical protein
VTLCRPLKGIDASPVFHTNVYHCKILIVLRLVDCWNLHNLTKLSFAVDILKALGKLESASRHAPGMRAV